MIVNNLPCVSMLNDPHVDCTASANFLEYVSLCSAFRFKVNCINLLMVVL